MLEFLAAQTTNYGPQFIGEIVLLTVAAVLVGFGTYKALPASMSPKLFAVLVPFLVLGGLAYMGSYTAATAVVLFVIIAVAAIAMGIS